MNTSEIAVLPMRPAEGNAAVEKGEKIAVLPLPASKLAGQSQLEEAGFANFEGMIVLPLQANPSRSTKTPHRGWAPVP